MGFKHNGGEVLTACAVGACTAAAPAVTSATGPLLAAFGIGTGVALSRKKSKKKKKSSKKKKSLKKGGKCKKSLKKKKQSGGVCPNCYDEECDECKIKREEEELNEPKINIDALNRKNELQKIKWMIRKKEMRKECSNLVKLLKKKKIPLEKAKEYAKKMVEQKYYCDDGYLDSCEYCKDEYLKHLKTKKGSIMTPEIPDEAKPEPKTLSHKKSTTRRRRQAPNERLNMLTYAAQQTSKRKKTKRDLLDINKSRERLSRSSSKKSSKKTRSSIGGKSKRKSKKKQKGGNMNINNIIFILLLFYFMYKQSVTMDLDDIKDIDVGYSDDLILPEEVGLSLIPYTQEVSDAIINYVMSTSQDDTTLNNAKSHILSLDDNGNIEDVKLYYNPYMKHILDYKSKDYEHLDYVQTYKNRDLALQYSDRWFDTEIKDYNLPVEGDISKILEVCLPGIHLLTGRIPKKLFMSGVLSKNVNIFNPQWHQDYTPGLRLYPNVADYNIRLMLIPQTDYETKYPELINFSKDTKLTDFATQVNNYKPENRLHPDNIGYKGGPDFDYFGSNVAQKVNLKIDQTKYVGIMFNNYKLFHKSPDIDGFLRSTQRDIIQLQFFFNDKDLITPTSDIKEDLGEFNDAIIQNIDDKLNKKNDANIEEIFGGMFRN
tara:strand:+ start:1670 stop:3637 length:1968 start_codon:yes stop_codon:yes gene_type:complete